MALIISIGCSVAAVKCKHKFRFHLGRQQMTWEVRISGKWGVDNKPKHVGRGPRGSMIDKVLGRPCRMASSVRRSQLGTYERWHGCAGADRDREALEFLFVSLG